MSVSLTTPGLIRCDGGHWPCSAICDGGTLSTARETRRDASDQGWKVGVRNIGSHRRLDFCPRHSA